MPTSNAHPGEVSQTTSTAMAREQEQFLHRTLGRLDIVLMTISAVVGLEMLGSVSSHGGETFTWLLVLTLFFLVPYALVFAETGAAFVGEGGVYLWVRQAFGRPAAAVASALTWITQPVWVGGSMAFLCAGAARTGLWHFADGSVGDWAFKLGFIWVTVFAAIMSLKRAKWIPTVGTVFKLIFLALFLGTAVVYATQHGLQHFNVSSMTPTLAGFLGITPLLLFAFLGFESSSSASGEMVDAQRDVAVGVLRSSASAALLYIIPVLTILLTVPDEKIDGLSGVMNSVSVVFGVYGSAHGEMLALATVLFILANTGQGAAWMILSDRMQAITAADGSFFGGYFGRFHRTLGTPIRVNLMSAVLATVFMVAAMQLSGSAASAFGVVLNVSITTYLFSYLLIIPAVAKLRVAFPDAHRPFRVPGSDAVFVGMAMLCTAWVALGSWVALFPGTLEKLFGVDYDFVDSWGVPFGQFEAITLGTLLFIVVLALVGFVLGAPIRRERPADASLEELDPTATA